MLASFAGNGLKMLEMNAHYQIEGWGRWQRPPTNSLPFAPPGLKSWGSYISWASGMICWFASNVYQQA